MPSIFERLDNREAFPVDIKGGTVYLREPTFADIDRVRALMAGDDDKDSSGLALALCLVQQDGAREFQPLPDETDQQLSARAIAATKCLTPSDMRKIQDAIKKLTEPVDQDELAKN